MGEAVRLLGVAVQLLTRVPVPVAHRGADDLARAAGAFPLVGLAVAALAVTVRAGAGVVWGPVVGTIAAVAVAVALTGALHEDGLADVADGLWGGREPEQRLAIMRDSRVGTYGIVALVTVLGLRVALLVPLDVISFAKVVALAHVLGQAGMVLVARVARPVGGGLGSTFGQPPVSAVVLAGAVAAATAAISAGWLAPVVLAVAGVAALACAGVAERRLGGFTGDVLGATNSVVHVTVLAAAVALR